MPKFSKKSLAQLETCHPDLQRLFHEVIKHFDCTILEGFRGKEAQNKAFAEGKSQVKWPNGKHNKSPSLAVDVAPYPIDFNDLNRYRYFAGFVKGVASQMGINIVSGCDWDNDTQLKDNKFQDYGHFEIIISDNDTA